MAYYLAITGDIVSKQECFRSITSEYDLNFSCS
jgi:hypothetical protein